MSVKFKGPLFNKQEFANSIRKAFNSVAEADLKKVIVDGSISKGISPVEGDGKYQKYSESYKKAIDSGRYAKYGKSKSPVNLKLSGEMLDTFFASFTNAGLKIGFASKLANIHSKEGAGKSKVIRKLLPVDNGDTFKRSITKQIIDLVQIQINRILGK